MTASTLSSNTAPGRGGGIYNYGTLSLSSTIVAGNNTAQFGGGDCLGLLTSQGDNVVGIGDGCGLSDGVNGDQVGTASSPLNPLLGPLQDNGGPTRTMVPLPGSPAIDVVAPAHCVSGADQRGQPRPDAGDAGVCDVGAVEVNYPPQPPGVRSVVPNRGPYTGGTSVAIHGANLVGPDGQAAVFFGGVAAAAVVTSASALGTLITATSPATGGVGTVDVTVQTSLGSSPRTPNDGFTYTTAGMIYVAPTGSDANGCGTPAAPCRTLAYAVNVAAAGASVLMAAGTYPATVTIPTSLTVTGAGAGQTLLDGGGAGTVLTVSSGVTAAISGVTIQHGSGVGSGGGIANYGTLTLTASTLSGNTASGNGGGNSGNGGGIYNNYGTLTLNTSTLSGNAASGGGGILNRGTLIVTDSTLSGNTAMYNNGGGIYNYSGTLTLGSTIVAGNTASSGGPDCSGLLTSRGDNVVGIGDGCGLSNGVKGDQVGSSGSPLNALLGPLQDNGGPTQTMAPLPGSPAIDHGATPASGCPATDQRGVARPDAGEARCDVGAFESADAPATLTITPPAASLARASS